MPVMSSSQSAQPRYLQSGLWDHIDKSWKNMHTMRYSNSRFYAPKAETRNTYITVAYLTTSVHTYLGRCPGYLDEEKHDRIRFEYNLNTSRQLFSHSLKDELLFYTAVAVFNNANTIQCALKIILPPYYTTTKTGGNDKRLLCATFKTVLYLHLPRC